MHTNNIIFECLLGYFGFCYLKLMFAFLLESSNQIQLHLTYIMNLIIEILLLLQQYVR